MGHQQDRAARREHQLLRLLVWLAQFPWQRPEDLAFALGSSQATIHRLLALASEVKAVERIKLNRSNWYVISPRGLALVSHSQYQLAAPHWSREQLLRLLPRLPHWRVCQQLIQELLRRAPAQLALHTRAAQQGRVHWLWTWVRDYQASVRLGPQGTLRATALLWLGVLDPSAGGTRGNVGSPSEEQLTKRIFSVHIPLLLDSGLPVAGDAQRQCKQLTGWFALQTRSSSPYGPRVAPVVLLLSPGAGPAAPMRRLILWRQAAERARSRLGLSEQEWPPVLVALLSGPPGSRLAWQSISWYSLWNERPCSPWTLLTLAPGGSLLPGVLDALRSPASPAARAGAAAGSWPSQRRTRWPIEPLPPPTQQADPAGLAYVSTRLGERHLQLLRCLFLLPLADIEELASVFEPPHTRTLETLGHLLADLRRAGCVRPVEPPSPLPQPRGGPHWRLTERGLQLLAAETGLPLSALAARADAWPGEQWGQRAVRGLWRQWEHSQQIRRLLLQLIQAAGQAVAWWEMAPHTAHQDGHLTVIPDLLIAYRDAQGNRIIWIEVDRGTLKRQQYLSKWHRYLALSQRQVSRLYLYLVCPTGSPARLHLSHLMEQVASNQPSTRLVVRLAEWEQVQRAGAALLSAPLWRQILPPPGPGREQVAFLDP